MEEVLLAALAADPSDDVGWHALADWLEEQDRANQAELARLHVRLRRGPLDQRSGHLARRQQELLDEGTRHVLPALSNSLGMKFVLVAPGTFLMGSPLDEEGRQEDEGPQRAVTLTRGFWLGTTPVAQGEYRHVTGNNPSHFRGGEDGNWPLQGKNTSRFPVEQVTWGDAVAFCKELSELPAEKAAGRVYRLPTEAEWEYAARAGSLSRFPLGDTVKSLARVAWYYSNCRQQTHPVGRKAANAWGLHDLLGNVWEWCADWYGRYDKEDVIDPRGPSSGQERVLRGAGWSYEARFCRVAYRHSARPNEKNDHNGFRVVCELAARRG